jgi:hypothetical protein
VLAVEDWARIRRLHRAERMSIFADRAGGGILEEYGAVGAGIRWSAEV